MPNYPQVNGRDTDLEDESGTAARADAASESHKEETLELDKEKSEADSPSSEPTISVKVGRDVNGKIYVALGNITIQGHKLSRWLLVLFAIGAVASILALVVTSAINVPGVIPPAFMVPSRRRRRAARACCLNSTYTAS